MKFCVEEPESPQCRVSLRQDEDDVDILINDRIIAFFRGSSGELELMNLSECNQPKGVQFSPLGCIMVTKL